MGLAFQTRLYNVEVFELSSISHSPSSGWTPISSGLSCRVGTAGGGRGQTPHPGIDTGSPCIVTGGQRLEQCLYWTPVTSLWGVNTEDTTTESKNRRRRKQWVSCAHHEKCVEFMGNMLKALLKELEHSQSACRIWGQGQRNNWGVVIIILLLPYGELGNVGDKSIFMSHTFYLPN